MTNEQREENTPPELYFGFMDRSFDTYGFNSTRAPPFIEELVELQKKLIEMVRNVKYVDTIRNELQDRLRKETKEIKKDSKLFVPADKTSNHYKLNVATYDQPWSILEMTS